jgi:hypothetical protein
MTPRFLVAASFVALSVALLPRSAWAQDSATAAALFDKGVADMQTRQFATACPALEESQRLEPRAGTLFTLAECQAHWGKVASAVAHYQEYVGLVPRLPADQQSRHRDRVKSANSQIAKLKPTVPTLTLLLPADVPAGTSVTRNGVLLQGAALGLALPSDPGEYIVVTRTPGGAERQVTISVALGEAKRMVLEVSTDSPTTPVAPITQPPGATDSGANDAPATPSKSQHSKTPAYVVGAVGVAGIVVGSVTGILVFGQKSTVSAECSDHVCSEDGLSAANRAQSLAMVSNIGFGVGIAGLATAAILLLTAPRTETTSSTASPARAARWEPRLSGTPGGAWAGLQHSW